MLHLTQVSVAEVVRVLELSKEYLQKLLMVIVSLSALCSMQLLVQLCLCVCSSMKKGQIVRISRQLPRDCPFQSYADLHNHWSSLVGLNTHTHKLSHSVVLCLS